MFSSEISFALIIILILTWSIHLLRQNSLLKKENLRLLEKSGEYAEMQNEAKEILKDSTEVKTVKSLREKYNLSLIDAKQLVDSVNQL